MQPTALARNRQLVATWDTLSLMLCMGVHEHDSEQVPTATGETNLVLAPIDANQLRLHLGRFGLTRLRWCLKDVF